MILTVTALPSPADSQGSHSPNVTAPLFSTAPSVLSGSRLRDIRHASRITRMLSIPPCLFELLNRRAFGFAHEIVLREIVVPELFTEIRTRILQLVIDSKSKLARG